jgi:hypothetical protein
MASELITLVLLCSSTALGTKAIIELTRLNCKWKKNQKEKGTDETPLCSFSYVLPTYIEREVCENREVKVNAKEVLLCIN